MVAGKTAIIGGGIFGAMTAIRLAESGRSVSLFERLPGLMQGASSNANRLHMGFHYPRDDETARQCRLGYDRFRDEFPSCILDNVSNAYFIAKAGSLTSSSEFLTFCDRLKLNHSMIDLARFAPLVQNVEMGVMTAEVVFDPAILRRLITERLQRANVSLNFETHVTDISHNTNGFALSLDGKSKASFDAVVNCSYPEINRLTSALGHQTIKRQYEYTAAALVDLKFSPATSITILDGPFMTLMPFGATGYHLLYHVEHSVIARERQFLLDPAWLTPASSPFSAVDRLQWFAALLDKCCEFVPALHGAGMKRILEGPRMVLADREISDERPSFVVQHERGYLSAFSGKIDHCMWVADDVARALS